MKKIKKLIILAVAVFAIAATSVIGVSAASYQTPAEVLAGLTGETVENVRLERQETNKSYGAIAAEAGKLDEFKNQMLVMKKDNLETQVKEGRITQEEADQIIQKIEENQKNCDGRSSERIGQNEGAKFGSNCLGQGQGHGQGERQGQTEDNRGQKEGRGQAGIRKQDGTCFLPSE